MEITDDYFKRFVFAWLVGMEEQFFFLEELNYFAIRIGIAQAHTVG